MAGTCRSKSGSVVRVDPSNSMGGVRVPLRCNTFHEDALKEKADFSPFLLDHLGSSDYAVGHSGCEVCRGSLKDAALCSTRSLASCDLQDDRHPIHVLPPKLIALSRFPSGEATKAPTDLPHGTSTTAVAPLASRCEAAVAAVSAVSRPAVIGEIAKDEVLTKDVSRLRQLLQAHQVELWQFLENLFGRIQEDGSRAVSRDTQNSNMPAEAENRVSVSRSQSPRLDRRDFDTPAEASDRRSCMTEHSMRPIGLERSMTSPTLPSSSRTRLDDADEQPRGTVFGAGNGAGSGPASLAARAAYSVHNATSSLSKGIPLSLERRNAFSKFGEDIFSTLFETKAEAIVRKSFHASDDIWHNTASACDNSPTDVFEARGSVAQITADPFQGHHKHVKPWRRHTVRSALADGSLDDLQLTDSMDRIRSGKPKTSYPEDSEHKGCKAVMQIDWNAGHPADKKPMSFSVIGICFTAVFAMELFMRIVASGTSFFCAEKSQLWWNWLDLVIVITSVAEAVVFFLSMTSTSESKLSKIAAIRMLKLMRIFKLGRVVRFLRPLKILVSAIFHTLKSVFWSLVLLALIVYCFGIIFTTAASDYFKLLAYDPSAPRISQLGETKMKLFYGGLGDSMLTLFMCIVGGINWSEAIDPLRELGMFWLVLFLAYICFTTCAVLNVVTGIFCQSAIESTQDENESLLHVFLTNEKAMVDRFKMLFSHMDMDASGTITLEDFESCIEDPKVSAYFETLDLDPEKVLYFFKHVCSDSSNQEKQSPIELEDFIESCLRLKGPAKSCDLAQLMFDFKRTAREIRAISNIVQRKLI
eukprot:TRINITY_DN29316_c0_g1_i1.p1 TRINITY_DN29316_c0_g1~~TRINITY_DN29316_c0_g1_i1.p1  ORF type:complete len:813 (+),score=139.16 TRINITY_DN29316_c0_g1_i1:154-2592(+)